MNIKQAITIGMFGFALTAASAADAAETLQTQQQIQLQSQDRVGPEVPKNANQQQKQHKNTYEYRYEKQNQNRIEGGAQNGNKSDRSVIRPMNRSGMSSGSSMGGANRSGGGAKR